MTKIIFSNYDDIKNPYYAGGGSFAVHHVAKYLAQQGNEVTVLTGKYPGAKDEIVDGVKYQRTGLQAGPKLGQLIFQFTLWYHVLRSDFDVWVESFTPPFSTACLQLFTRKPVIGVTHLLGARNMMKKYKLPFAYFERIGLKTYRNVIALSEHIAELVKQASPNTSVAVIPNGIDSKMANLQISKTASGNALFLGRIDLEHKGIDYLLDAWKLASGKTSKKLLIAGSGRQEEVEWMKSRIIELQLQHSINYLGKVSEEQKSNLLSSAAIVLMPSRFEGQGIVALEAFAYQAALVCFDIPDLDWIPDNCVRKVKAFDTTAFGEAAVDLLENFEAREALQNRAKQFVKGFAWDGILKSYDQLISEVAI